MAPDDHELSFTRAGVRSRIIDPTRKSIDSVVGEYRELLAAAPTVAKYWVALAGFQNRCGRTEDAEKTFLEAGKATEESVEIAIAYARFLHQQKERTAEALPLLLKATSLKPKEIMGHLALANHYLLSAVSDVPAAMAALQKARELDPADFRPCASLAGIHVRRQEYDKAEAVLREGLAALAELAGDNPAELPKEDVNKYRAGVMELNNVLIDVLLAAPREDGSKEKIIASVKTCLENMERINRNHAYVEKALGRVALEEGDFTQAVAHLAKAHAMFGGGESQTATLLANLYLSRNQPGDAEAVMQALVRAVRRRERGKSGASAKVPPGVQKAIVQVRITSRSYERAMDALVTLISDHGSDDWRESTQAALQIALQKRARVPEKIKKLFPEAQVMILQRASRLWEEGQRNAAIVLAEDVRVRSPGNMRAVGYVYVWLKAEKEPDKAQLVYDQAIETFKDNPVALRRLELLAETDPQKRLEMQLAEAEREPSEVIRALRIATIYQSVGDEKRYLEFLQKAEAVDPEHRLVVDRLFTYYLGKDDLAQAEKYADVAASKNIDSVGGKVFRARIAQRQQKWDEAIRLARQMLRVRPQFAAGHVLLADCLLEMDKTAEAKAEYELAYRQNPSLFSALMGLIRISEREGKRAEFFNYVELAYRQNPRNPALQDAHLRMQEMRAGPQELKKIILHRETIAANQPGNGRNLVQLAGLYERDQQLAKAEEVFRRLAADPRAGAAEAWMLAKFLQRTGRQQDGQDVLTRHVEKASDKLEAYLVWGQYLESAGRNDLAEAALRKAVGVDKEQRRSTGVIAEFFARLAKWDQAIEFWRKHLTAMGEDVTDFQQNRFIDLLISGKKFDEAGRLIEERISSGTRGLAAMTLKGRMLLVQDKPDQAKVVLDKALSQDSQFVAALLFRSQVYEALKDVPAAVADMEAALRIRQDPLTVLRLAGVHARRNDFAKSYAVLQAFLADSPGNVIVRRETISLCRRFGRWTELATAAQKGMELFPREPFFYVAEGMRWLYGPQPHAGRALAALRKADELGPGDPNRRVLLLEALARAGQVEEAKTLTDSLRTDENVGPAAMAILGRVYLGRKDTAAAEKEFTAALKAARDVAQTERGFGYILAAHADNARKPDLDRWIAVRPDDWVVYHLAGRSAGADGQRKSALDYELKALERIGDGQRKWVVLQQAAMLHCALGQFDKGVKAYQDVLEILPDFAPALNNLAWTLAKDLGKPKDALPHAKRAAELMPRNAQILDTYGFVLVGLGQYDQAVDVLRRSTSRERFPANLLHYGTALEAQGKKNDAYVRYQQGWELVKNDPEHATYQELRAAYSRLGGSP